MSSKKTLTVCQRFLFFSSCPVSMAFDNKPVLDFHDTVSYNKNR